MPAPAPPAPEPSTARRPGLVVRLVLSVLLAVAFAAVLWPYLRAVPQDLSIAPWALPAYLLTLVPYHLARAGRWHALVRPLGPVPLSVTLRVSLAGYMWIALLPFRLGELARPLLLAQRSDITVHRALGTVAIERVLDGLVICGLFFAATAATAKERRELAEVAALQHAATGVMILFATALVGLVLMARWPRAIGGLLDATLGRVLPRLGTWAAEASRGVAEGLRALPRGGSLLAFVLVTLVYWGSNALGLWVLARGCGLPISPADAALVMAVMNIALLVPGGPAQLGIFQTGVALGLTMVLPPGTIRDDGSTFAFYLYICQLSTIVLAGWWSQHALRLDWRAVIDLRAPSRPRPAAAANEARRARRRAREGISMTEPDPPRSDARGSAPEEHAPSAKPEEHAPSAVPEPPSPAPTSPASARMRGIAKGVLQLLLGVALFALVVWWVAPPWDEIRDRIRLLPGWLLVSLLGSAAATFVTAARWKLLSEMMGGSRLPYGIYFHYLALTRLVGQVLPTVLVDVFGRGAALKAAGSDSRLGQLIAPVILERVLDLLLPLALLGWAIAVHLRLAPGWLDPWVSLALLVLVFVLVTVPLLDPLVRMALWAYGWMRRLRRHDRTLPLPPAPEVTVPLSARIVAFGVLRYASIQFQYWGAGAGLGVLLAPLVLVMATPLAQLAGLVGITPGGLGMQEGGWVAALEQLGEEPAAIVVFMAGTRIMMSVNFGVLTLLSWPWRRVRTRPPATG